MNDLEQFRSDKNELFHNQSESPLSDEQKAEFKGLNYYSDNPDLVLHDLTVELLPGEEIVPIQTSSGDTEAYDKLGKVSFEIAGTPVKLTVYKNKENGNIFLPFKDSTNASETYHDGRYVEVEIEGDKIPELDFNYAYNPYCAYNDKWRCPITPEENTLPVEIKAGEKRFH